MLFTIVCDINEIKNVYNIFKTVHNNLNDVMNIVNHVKCKLKCDIVEHEKLNN